MSKNTTQLTTVALAVGALALAGCSGGSSTPSGLKSSTSSSGSTSGSSTGGSTGSTGTTTGTGGSTSGGGIGGIGGSGSTGSGSTGSTGTTTGTGTSGTGTSGTSSGGLGGIGGSGGGLGHSGTGTSGTGTGSSGTGTGSSGTGSSGTGTSGTGTGSSGTGTSGSTGTSGTGTSGTGTGGIGTIGGGLGHSGTGTSGTGTGSSGTGTSGTGTGSSGTGTSGTGTHGTGTSGTGTSGTGTSGTGTSGTGTHGTGTSGTGTSGSGTSGSGTSGSGTPTGGTTASSGIWIAESFESSPYSGVGVMTGNGAAVNPQTTWGVGPLQDANGNSLAYDGNNIAAIGWGNGYVASQNDILIFPAMDLSAAQQPTLDFQTTFNIQTNGSDVGMPIVFDGSNWNFPDGNGGWTTTPTTGYEGQQNSWAEQVFDLSSFAGDPAVYVGFWFVSGTSVASGFGGFWALDAVVVAEYSVLSQAGMGSGGTTTGSTGSTGTGTSGTGTGTSGTGTTTGTGTGTGSAQVLFSEDFDGSSINVGEYSFASPQTVEWYVDDPSNYGFNGNGTISAGQFGYTDQGAEDLLYTPMVDFTGASTGKLSFDATFALNQDSSGNGLDGLRLLVTDGNTWYLLSPDQGYPATVVDAFTDSQGNTCPGFSGTQSSWKTYTVDLSALTQSGTTQWQFAWEFATDPSTTGNSGFFIDNLKITAQ